MKYSAFNSPVTTAIFSGLTYAAIVLAMFTSLTPLFIQGAHADSSAVVKSSNYALSAPAAGSKRPTLEVDHSEAEAEQMFTHLQNRVSEKLNKQLEKKFEQQLSF